jgi:hypothetical protein
MKGKLTVAGTMVVDGEELTGVFIECSKEEMRNHIHVLYSEVEIRAAIGAPAEQSGEAPRQQLKQAIALVLEATPIFLSGSQRAECEIALNDIRQQACV